MTRIQYSLIPFALGLGLVLVLLWALEGGNAPAVAAPVSSVDGTSVVEGLRVGQTQRPSALLRINSAKGARPGYNHHIQYPNAPTVELRVCASGCLYSSIQDAVDAANDGAVIKVAAGIYTDVNDYGGLAQIVYVSKSVTIRGGYTITNWTSSDPETNLTTLDAHGIGRGIYIAGSISPAIEGLYITGGDAAGLGGGRWGDGAGGGVYVVTATVTISNCRVFSNTAQEGGGLYLHESNAAINDNTIGSNTAQWGGGLNLSGGTVALRGNVVSSNTADDGGGGLYLYDSNATFNGNMVSSNTAYWGGGLKLSESAAILNDNTFSSNIAQGGGGGLTLGDSAVTLTGNVVTSNTATWGGGLRLGFSGYLYLPKGQCLDVTLSANTIRTNTALYGGGGLYLSLADSYPYAPCLNVTFSDNAISDNVAERGGGLYLNLLRHDSYQATFNGNVIRANTAQYGGGLYLVNGTDATLVNTILADNQGSTGSGLYLNWNSSLRLLHTTMARNRSPGGSDSGDGIHVAGSYSTVALTNTILVSHRLGITVAAGSTVRLAATLWGDSAWANDVDVGGAGTVISSTNLTGDPAFVDPDGGNYHVAPASVAVDGGVDSGVLDDVDGDPRPANLGYDLGADEQPGAVLRLREIAWQRYFNSGRIVTYTVLITNVGAVEATDLLFTGTLPLYQRPVEIVASQGFPCGGGTGWGAAVVCPLGNVDAGQTAVVTLTAQVTSTQLEPLPYPMVNVVQVQGDNVFGETSLEVYMHDCHVRVNGDLPEYGAVQAGVDAAGAGDTVMVAGYCGGASKRAGLWQQVYLDRELTLQGGWSTDFTVRDPDLYPATLDAYGEGRVLYITGASSAPDGTFAPGQPISPTIDGLEITGGDAAGLGGDLWGDDSGGGVYLVTAAATISNCRVFGNAAQAGGGLYLLRSAAMLGHNVISSNDAEWGGGLLLDFSPATLDSNTVAANTARQDGGGLHLYESDATLSSNTVISNTAFGVIMSGGGGLYLYRSDATLSGNVVSANTAQWIGGGLRLEYSNATLSGNVVSGNASLNGGGGLCLSHSDAVLISNVISANTTGGNGGGLFVQFSPARFNRNVVSANTADAGGGGLYLHNSDVEINGNTIMSNTAGYNGGGGLFVSGGSDATLVNTIVADNRAGNCGGGVRVHDSSPSLLHTTIARNDGGDGSGICVTNFYGSSTVALTNTILVSHGVGIAVTAGNVATFNGVLWYGNATDTDGDGTIVVVNEHTGAPLFVDPDAGDYHITSSSTAIDRGVHAGVDHDVDGHVRPCGAGYDLGADELCPALVVAKQARPDPVQAGERLTYTIRVTNTGGVDLHAAITDTLPSHVALDETSGGTLVLPDGRVEITWTTFIAASDGVWMETVAVTVEEGYEGPLANWVKVATQEGAAGEAYVIVNAYKVYLPLVLKNLP